MSKRIFLGRLNRLRVYLANFVYFHITERARAVSVCIEHKAPILPSLLNQTPQLPAAPMLAPLTEEQIGRIKTAARQPDGWRPVKSSESWKGADNAAQLIDAAMLALVDLAPERYGWHVINLCELLITPDSDTRDHMEVMAELLSLMPLGLHTEAMGHISALMTAGCREVVTLGLNFSARKYMERKGWLTA